MEEQLAQLIKVISQLGTVLIFMFGLFLTMIGSVIVAEFIRRERTITKEDDWFERSIERKDPRCNNCIHRRGIHARESGVCQFGGCSCQVFKK